MLLRLLQYFCLATATSSVALSSTNQFSNSLPNGIHISVTENNQNLVTEINDWNQNNQSYQNFLKKASNNLITVPFQDWNQITNSYQTSNQPANQLTKKVVAAFQQQITTNPIFSKAQATEKFAETAVGRSVAMHNPNDEINSFGITYLPYCDSKPTKINNGLLATINESSKYENAFPIPYNITPDPIIFTKYPDPASRLKTFVLKNDQWDVNNETTLVIFAKKEHESLQIINDNQTKIDVINHKNLAYALLSYNFKTDAKGNRYTINVYNQQQITAQKTVSLTNTTSDIMFSTKNEQDQKVPVQFQYLIQKNQNPSSNNLLVVNETTNSVVVDFKQGEQWNRYLVDSNTLQPISSSAFKVNSGSTMQLDELDNNKIYLFEKLDENQKLLPDSVQYLVLYRNEMPKLPQCSDLALSQNLALKEGLQRYYQAEQPTSDFIDLMHNPSAFLNCFINYETDLANHYYINYTGVDSQNPWFLHQSWSSITLVNHWGIVVIIILTTIGFIIIPIVIRIIRVRNRIK